MTRDVLVVSGSRTITDAGLVAAVIRGALAACAARGTTIVTLRHGGASKGVDRVVADTVGPELNLRLDVRQAKWSRYGRGAGFLRNVQMLAAPDVAAFAAVWDGQSPGTRHAIEEATARGIFRIVADLSSPAWRRFDGVVT